MTDLHRACKTLRTHLTQRRLLHATLDAQAETGVRAQDFTVSDKPTPIDPPPRPDPTGEQAISGDRARQLRGELDHAEARIVDTVRLLRSGTRDIHQAIHVIILLDGYGPRPQSKPQREAIRTIDGAAQTIHRITVEVLNPANLKPSDLDNLSSDGEAGCESCARLNLGTKTKRRPWWNVPYTDNPTTVNGNLATAKLLCHGCYTYVRTNNALPPLDELEHKHDKGKWKNRIDTAA